MSFPHPCATTTISQRTTTTAPHQQNVSTQCLQSRAASWWKKPSIHTWTAWLEPPCIQTHNAADQKLKTIDCMTHLQHHVAEAWPDRHILQQPLYIILQAQHEDRSTTSTHGHALHVASSTIPSTLRSADAHSALLCDYNNSRLSMLPQSKRCLVCQKTDKHGPWLHRKYL